MLTRRPTLIILFALAVLSVVFFAPLTLGGQALFWGMPYLQFWPWRSFAVAEYLSGHVPLWNPYSGFGMPLAANLQSGVFYPLNFYYLFLPVERAQTVSLVLHVFLAGCTSFGLGRALGLGRPAAALMGVTYMFSGFVVAQGNFHNITSVLAWTPAVFWGVEALLAPSDRRGRALATAGLAAAVALLLTGGFVQYAYYTLLAAGGWTLSRLVHAVSSGVPVRVSRVTYGIEGSPDIGTERMDPVTPYPTRPPSNGPFGGTPPLPPGKEVLPPSLHSPAGDSPEAAPSLQSPTSNEPASGVSLLRVATATAVRRGLPIAAAIALGVLLAAVQLLPTLELTRQSVRQGGLTYEDSTAASLWPGLLLTAVAPDVFGSQATNDRRVPGTPWEGVIFLGALPLLLALAGAGSKHPQRWFFVALAVVGLLLALGKYNPLYPLLFQWAPGLSLFHAPARFALWYLIGASVLAGMGAQAMFDGAPLRRLSRFAVAVGGTLAVVGLALTGWAGGQAWAGHGGQALAAGGLWLAAAGGLLLARGRVSAMAARLLGRRVDPPLPLPRQGGESGALAALAMVFVTVNLWYHGAALVPGVDARLYTDPPAPQVAALRQAAHMDRIWVSDRGYLEDQLRYFNFTGFWVTDLAQLRQARDQLMPNLGMPDGLYEGHNYDPLRLWRPAILEGLAADAAQPDRFLDLMGVRFLPPQGGLPAGLREWGRIGDTPVLERSTPLPRAFVVAVGERAPGQFDALARVQRPDFDPRRVAVLETPEGVALPSGAAPVTPATVTRYEHQRLTVEAEAPAGGGVLVVSDAWYPGWDALVDGVSVPIYPADLAFRGVLLPPGRHTVEMRYEPASFGVGLVVSAAALVVTLALLVRGLRGRRAA